MTAPDPSRLPLKEPIRTGHFTSYKLRTVHELATGAPRKLAGGRPKSYTLGMSWRELIEATPGVRGGKPRIVGTRITPSDVLEYLAGGMSEDDIIADFPSLRREHIRAVLAYAAERERRYVLHSGA